MKGDKKEMTRGQVTLTLPFETYDKLEDVRTYLRKKNKKRIFWDDVIQYLLSHHKDC